MGKRGMSFFCKIKAEIGKGKGRSAFKFEVFAFELLLLVLQNSLFYLLTSFLQCYRMGVLLAIAWLIRDHQLRLRVQGDWPVNVAEVREFLPDAHQLSADRDSPRKGSRRTESSTGEKSAMRFGPCRKAAM